MKKTTNDKTTGSTATSPSAANSTGTTPAGATTQRSTTNTGRADSDTASDGTESDASRTAKAKASDTGNGQGRQLRHAQEGLVKLFDHQLEDLYYVEKQLIKALPTMSRAASDRRLRRAFDMHLDETKRHVQRLEEIFEWLDKKPKAEDCEAIDGILAEAKSMMAEFKDDPAIDAALVCAAQKVEHYEITSYGSLCAFAEQLGWDKVCDILEETLDEEKDTDHKLSMLAEQVLNYEAHRGSLPDGQEPDQATGGNSRTAARTRQAAHA